MTNPAQTRFGQQFAHAQTLQKQGQLTPARLIYQQILDAEPDHFDALNAMGVLAGQSKDLQQALQYFERAIAIQPGNSGAHCNRGISRCPAPNLPSSPASAAEPSVSHKSVSGT